MSARQGQCSSEKPNHQGHYELLEHVLASVGWGSKAKSIKLLPSGAAPHQALADEVLDSLLDGFDDSNQDTAWHGGCLALAELARRGLLLPARLPALAPLLAAALQYDVRRGAHRSGMIQLALRGFGLSIRLFGVSISSCVIGRVVHEAGTWG